MPKYTNINAEWAPLGSYGSVSDFAEAILDTHGSDFDDLVADLEDDGRSVDISDFGFTKNFHGWYVDQDGDVTLVPSSKLAAYYDWLEDED